MKWLAIIEHKLQIMNIDEHELILMTDSRRCRCCSSHVIHSLFPAHSFHENMGEEQPRAEETRVAEFNSWHSLWHSLKELNRDKRQGLPHPATREPPFFKSSIPRPSHPTNSFDVSSLLSDKTSSDLKRRIHPDVMYQPLMRHDWLLMNDNYNK